MRVAGPASLLDGPRPDGRGPEGSVLGVEERIVSDLSHLPPHILGHLYEPVPMGRIVRQVVPLVRVLGQIVELVDAAGLNTYFQSPSQTIRWV